MWDLASEDLHFCYLLAMCTSVVVHGTSSVLLTKTRNAQGSPGWTHIRKLCELIKHLCKFMETVCLNGWYTGELIYANSTNWVPPPPFHPAQFCEMKIGQKYDSKAWESRSDTIFRIIKDKFPFNVILGNSAIFKSLETWLVPNVYQLVRALNSG